MKSPPQKQRKTRESSNAKTSKKKSDHKPKREPLPMKLRALPQSFWQQPNAAATAPPSACSLTPPLPPTGAEDTSAAHLQITPADTDLLFSLFSTLPAEPEPGLRPMVRRGRPRKSGDKLGSSVRDEDPYVTSVTVPEVKFQKEAMAETKTLALMAFNDQQNGSSHWETSYAQTLQDLAVNL